MAHRRDLHLEMNHSHSFLNIHPILAIIAVLTQTFTKIEVLLRVVPASLPSPQHVFTQNTVRIIYEYQDIAMNISTSNSKAYIVRLIRRESAKSLGEDW